MKTVLLTIPVILRSPCRPRVGLCEALEMSLCEHQTLQNQYKTSLSLNFVSPTSKSHEFQRHLSHSMRNDLTKRMHLPIMLKTYKKQWFLSGPGVGVSGRHWTKNKRAPSENVKNEIDPRDNPQSFSPVDPMAKPQGRGHVLLTVHT